ncbi:MAG: PqqD family protein [Hyphomicrobium sp.]|uniref:PqqD family protein n=1 Tax=Hyphomicrobium sp. TaxID=82 RepID=UPI003568868E
MIDDDQVFALSDTVSFQPLGQGEGAVILLIESGEIFTCNDTTSAFLRALDGTRTFGNSVDLLAESFDVARPVLRSDLEQLARNLSEQRIIIEPTAVPQ